MVKSPGGKDQAIRDRFDLSTTRYHQILKTLIDRAEAFECAPQVVARL